MTCTIPDVMGHTHLNSRFRGLDRSLLELAIKSMTQERYSSIVSVGRINLAVSVISGTSGRSMEIAPSRLIGEPIAIPRRGAYRLRSCSGRERKTRIYLANISNWNSGRQLRYGCLKNMSLYILL